VKLDFCLHVRLVRLRVREECELSELVFESLVEMAQQVRARKISPVELVDAHLARIGELNPKLNAFVEVDSDRAREYAKAAEAALTISSKTDSLGALHGVPISIKSSIDVAGLRTECGSRLRKGIVAHEDAPLVARLRAAGAIILGNTNVPEFLMAYETDNLLYGRTNSPWDLERTPGGSSGGEAAAIAAGCSAGGIGSDGGGSVRIPAHYSGICGLKPTPGRIPSTGHYPGSAGPFAQLGVVGPMARTIRDVEQLFEVVAGPDPGDPCAAPVPLRRWTGAEISKLRVAYFEDDGVTPVTPETAAAVRVAAKALRELGFQVERWVPPGLERVWRLWWNLFGRAGQMAFEQTIAGREAELSPVLRDFRARVAAEPPLSAGELLNTLLERDVIRNAILAKMEEFPILLCPACAVPAFRHGEREWTVQGRRVEYLKAMSYSQWFNLLGNPAAVVPVSKSPEGLPIGVQIVGRPWEEEAVLAIAAKIEDSCGGFRRPLE
jgi:Asp-tRNA(Asn)/Glu-tRNA(Gln) amidotransferase A subunit family amidase